MAKIRGIKPETWTDDKFVRLSPLARLLFIGMWNLACDNGHVEDNAVQLKMRLLPMDACDVIELVDEMVETGQVERADGWLKVVNLVEHQRAPDRRFLTLCERCAHDEHAVYIDSDKLPRSASKAGPQAASSASTQRAHGEHTASTQRAHAGEGEGEGEGEGDGEGDGESPLSAPRKRAAKKPAKPLPEDWQPNDEHAKRAEADGIDLAGQVARFRAHAEANDRRQANWNAAFTQWLLNVPEWQRGTRPTASVHRLPYADEVETAPPGMTDAEYDAWEAAQREKRMRR